MSEKVAIFLLAGPEAPCRLVHTFIWALDIVGRGGETKIVLEGAAPAWLLELRDTEHTQHRLYQRVKGQGLIDAVCRACAIQANALEAASEAMGDYVMGPTHIMPTGGTARFASPCNVWDYIKITSVFASSGTALRRLSKAAETLAQAEGFTAHAAATKIRQQEFS